jgi:sulfur relay (sulfurtransferase) complex TusBCD TusD component (DsrE family)
MFRTVPLSIIRSFSLYTQQWYMSYRFSDSLRAGSGRNSVPLLCVQGKTLDDGQRNSPKHVEFYSKNKFEKLVHLVGFIIRICHDARSQELQIDL